MPRLVPYIPETRSHNWTTELAQLIFQPSRESASHDLILHCQHYFPLLSVFRIPFDFLFKFDFLLTLQYHNTYDVWMTKVSSFYCSNSWTRLHFVGRSDGPPVLPLFCILHTPVLSFIYCICRCSSRRTRVPFIANDVNIVISCYGVPRLARLMKTRVSILDISNDAHLSSLKSTYALRLHFWLLVLFKN